jgi:protein phosphatase
MASGTADTDEFVAPIAGHPRQTTARVEVEVAGLSDAGKVRPNNEDHFLVVRFGRFLESLQTNLPPGQVASRFENIGHAMAVADGMGGHAGGEEASRFALTMLIQLVVTTPDWIFRVDEPSFAEEVMRRASDRFEQIDHALAEEGDANPALYGFGTTMTLAANIGRDLFIAHMGDSRAYLFRGGKLHQLTRDHTLVRELCEAGIITTAQAATHHMRHALTRNLGGDRGAKPDVHRVALGDGDSLLLCSDGLTEMVSNDQIAALLAAGETPERTCRRLVDRALAAGGKDNVTAVVARYRIPAGR